MSVSMFLPEFAEYVADSVGPSFLQAMCEALQTM